MPKQKTETNNQQNKNSTAEGGSNENVDPLAGVSAQILESSKDLSAKLPVLGHVIWLYTQTSTHKYFSMVDVESRTLPALVLEQCKLYVQSDTGGLPMGFVSWARLSDEAEIKYMTTQRISPSDWKSGDNLWLIDIVTPYGNQEAIFRDLYNGLLKDEEIYFLFPKNGKDLKKTTLNELIENKDAHDAAEKQ